MKPRVCRCCGGEISAQSANENVCADCERLLEDDSPAVAAGRPLGSREEPQPASTAERSEDVVGPAQSVSTPAEKA